MENIFLVIVVPIQAFLLIFQIPNLTENAYFEKRTMHFSRVDLAIKPRFCILDTQPVFRFG